MKKIAIFDIDGTLIKGQSQEYLIKYLFVIHWINIGRYWVIIFWFIMYKIFYIKSINLIIEYAIKPIKGIKKTEIDKLFDKFFNEKLIPLIYENSKDLISHLRTHGYEIVLLSSAIEPIVYRFAKYFNVDNYISTRIELDNNVYTGKIIGEPIYSMAKAKEFRRFLDEKCYNKPYTISFADHYSDKNLLMSTNYPVAVNPDSKLTKFAKKNNWDVLYLESNESFQYFKSNVKFE